MAAVDVVVMAAGRGTRMKSAVPKVLHRLGGRALLDHVVAAAAGLKPRRLVVVTGHGAEQVSGAVRGFASAQGLACETVLQQPQLGTGHAVQQALPLLPEDGICLVLNGDVPLIETATLQGLLDACAGERLALLTADMADPTGYVVRRPMCAALSNKKTPAKTSDASPRSTPASWPRPTGSCAVGSRA